MKKSRRLVTIILCLLFLMSFSLGFATYATDSQERVDVVKIPEVVTRDPCYNCEGGWYTVEICRGVQAFSHQDTHTVKGQTCTRIWNRGYVDHTCDWCGYVVRSEFGHYCDVYHTICANESWCAFS